MMTFWKIIYTEPPYSDHQLPSTHDIHGLSILLFTNDGRMDKTELAESQLLSLAKIWTEARIGNVILTTSQGQNYMFIIQWFFYVVLYFIIMFLFQGPMTPRSTRSTDSGVVPEEQSQRSDSVSTSSSNTPPEHSEESGVHSGATDLIRHRYGYSRMFT